MRTIFYIILALIIIYDIYLLVSLYKSHKRFKKIHEENMKSLEELNKALDERIKK